MKSKIVIIIGVLFVAIVAFCAWFITILVALNHEEKVEWFKLSNPEYTITIEVEYIIPPPLGVQKIFVYVNESLLITTEISNDGKGLRDSNYKLDWIDNGATLSFSGEEQRTETFKITVVNGDISYSLIKD